MTDPTPRDTGPALDPRAVEAAAEALRHYEAIDFGASAGYTERDLPGAAEAALTAAAPFLRAEGASAERQRIAAAIYTACPHHTGIGACACCRRSARIVEADPGTTAPTEEAPDDAP